MGSLEGEHGKDPAAAAVANADHEVDISGREEGEIVDDSDLEDVSDISAEDEILLRIKILEEYNKALESKVKKDGRTSDIVDTQQRHRTERLLPGLADLSEISVSDIEDNNKVKNDPMKKAVRHTTRHKNVHKKSKRKKSQIIYKRNRYSHREAPKRNSNSKQNIHMAHGNKQERDRCRPKKNQKQKTIESSEESDYDNKEKRRKLQEAVRITSKKYDMSSLKQRLLKMIAPNKEDETLEKNSIDDKFDSLDTNLLCEETEQNKENKQIIELSEDTVYLITDDESSSGDTKKNVTIKTKDILKESDEQVTHENKGLLSDDDLESLRQLVLKTKNKKIDQGNINEAESVSLHSSPVEQELDEKDNDIEQLRMACLKSAMVRKAEGRKRRKERGSFMVKREKRPHRDSIMDYLFSEEEGHLDQDCTDVESVDMEIGVSDSPDAECEIPDDGEQGGKYDDDKLNELNAINNTLFMDQQSYYSYNNNSDIDTTSKAQIPDLPDLKQVDRIDGKLNAHDDLDDDEDLLRANLLTSLSERLPRLTVDNYKQQNKKENAVTIPLVQSLVVNLAETDSESDAETTKNLKKLHQSLSNDFQKNLDIFLKNARMQAENKKALLEQANPNSKVPTQKFTPKALNHLPKSHQLEYKRLLKRMAELERGKLARQAGLNEIKTINAPIKVTVSQVDEARTVVSDPKLNEITDKPYQAIRANVPELPELHRQIISTHNIKNASLSLLGDKYTPGLLEKKIELSRRKIAEEAATVMQLKAESKLLTQRVKLAAAELCNIRTALSLNKKKLHSAQITLTKTRTQHNSLISRTLSTNKYNKLNSLNATDNTRKVVHNVKNNSAYIMDKPVKLSTVNKMAVLQSVQISVKNDISNNTGMLSQREISSIQKEYVKATSVLKENNLSHNSVKDDFQEPDRIVIPTSENILKVSKQDQHQTKISTLEPNLCIESEKAADSNQRIVILETISDAPSGHLPVNIDSNSKDEDYRSPLQYIKHSWCDDPNAVLCPFEVDGWCKDADCKYLHTKRS